MEHSKEAKLCFYISGMELVGFRFSPATIFLEKYFKALSIDIWKIGDNLFFLLLSLFFFFSNNKVREGTAALIICRKAGYGGLCV